MLTNKTNKSRRLRLNAAAVILTLALPVFFFTCNDGSSKPVEQITETYTVKFDSNGGSAVAEQKVKENETASKPSPDPAREGYAFIGWYIDKELTALYDFTTPVTGDITLYAKWEEGFQITFNTNGGSAIPNQAKRAGEKVDRPAQDPTKENYTFDNWYADEALSTLFDFDTEVTGDITLYAKWQIKKYTVKFFVYDELFDEQQVEWGSAAAKPSPDPDLGDDVFLGWYTDAGAAYNFDTAVTTDLNLYAKGQITRLVVSAPWPSSEDGGNAGIQGITETMHETRGSGFLMESQTDLLQSSKRGSIIRIYMQKTDNPWADGNSFMTFGNEYSGGIDGYDNPYYTAWNYEDTGLVGTANIYDSGLIKEFTARIPVGTGSDTAFMIEMPVHVEDTYDFTDDDGTYKENHKSGDEYRMPGVLTFLDKDMTPQSWLAVDGEQYANFIRIVIGSDDYRLLKVELVEPQD